MKFKVRKSTDFLYILTQDIQGKTAYELRMEAVRKGELDIGVHYVIQKDGSVDQGREPYAVAQYSFRAPERSIYVLVDADSLSDLSDAQAFALDELISSTQGEYPNIQIMK